MGAMTLTAGLHQLRPPPCRDELHCIQPHKWQLSFLFISLGLLAIGAGAVRPCNVTFGADQFDLSTKKGRIQLQRFFNWWYLSFTIALVIALTGVIYIQTNINWVIGFAIPTTCLALSTTVFLLGRHTYIYKLPQGSVFLDMVKVSVAAFRKRKIKLDDVDEGSYYDPPSDAEWEAIKLLRSDRFGYLDKAAVITDPSEVDAQAVAVNNWRLCSLQQVENFKCIIGVIPVWLSGIGCLLVMDQQNTYGILQAIQMDRSLGRHFTIPPGWMGITSMIALAAWILLYEQLYVPIAKKVLKGDKRLTMHQRITIGIVISILCMGVAGTIEKQRRMEALREGTFASPLHVAALLPQFMLSGLTEAFAGITLMEFFTLKLPQTMRSVAGAIFFLNLSLASYVSSLIVNVAHSVTGGKGRRPWLGGRDINLNRLDNFYYIVGAIGILNLVYFTCFARRYLPAL